MREERIGGCELIGFSPRAVIYAFEKDGVVTYVGATRATIRSRVRAHLAEAANGSEVAVHRWIRSVGAEFTVRCLEYVSVDVCDDAEKRWITHYSGPHLQNMTDGGKGLSGYKPSEDRNRKIGFKLQKGSHFDCEVCGSQFWRKPRDIALGNNRFCSRGCYQDFQRGRPKWKTAS